MSFATIHRHEPSHHGAPVLQAVSGSTIANVSLFPDQRGLAALRYLAEAANSARELGRDPWDFAVEIQTLRELGLTNNHFRWLLCKGLVEHQQETTTVGDTRRVFQPDRPLGFSENACFVLSAEGLAYLHNGPVSLRLAALRAAPEDADAAPIVSRNGHGQVPDLLPKWDRERQELRVGGIVVKQFKAPAVNQERILAAFEEEGWPVHIDDPLPPHPAQDPKRRLHDTINSLNRNQKNPLVQFLGNGNGQGVRWKRNPGRNGESHGESS